MVIALILIFFVGLYLGILFMHLFNINVELY